MRVLFICTQKLVPFCTSRQYKWKLITLYCVLNYRFYILALQRDYRFLKRKLSESLDHEKKNLLSCSKMLLLGSSDLANTLSICLKETELLYYFSKPKIYAVVQFEPQDDGTNSFLSGASGFWSN